MKPDTQHCKCNTLCQDGLIMLQSLTCFTSMYIYTQHSDVLCLNVSSICISFYTFLGMYFWPISITLLMCCCTVIGACFFTLGQVQNNIYYYYYSMSKRFKVKAHTQHWNKLWNNHLHDVERDLYSKETRKNVKNIYCTWVLNKFKKPGIRNILIPEPAISHNLFQLTPFETDFEDYLHQ